MCIYRMKKEIFKHPPEEFFFASETDWEEIQFSYFLSVSKTLPAQVSF